jgi:hypothetical protein
MRWSWIIGRYGSERKRSLPILICPVIFLERLMESNERPWSRTADSWDNNRTRYLPVTKQTHAALSTQRRRSVRCLDPWETKEKQTDVGFCLSVASLEQAVTNWGAEDAASERRILPLTVKSCTGFKTLYESVSKSFRTESISKYTLTTINNRWEATKSVTAPKLTRLTHNTAIKLHLVAESYIICSSRSRRPLQKLLDTPTCRERD